MTQPQFADGSSPASQAKNIRDIPHDFNAEAALLGTMLMTPVALDEGLRITRSEHFYMPKHAAIFHAIQSVNNQGTGVDIQTVNNELQSGDELSRSVTFEFLGDLVASGPVAANAGHYAKIVRDKALLRQLISAAQQIEQIGYDNPKDVTAAIDESEEKIFKLAQGRISDSMRHIRELAEAASRHIEELADRGDQIVGTPTGFIDLDKKTSGLQPGTLVVIGARPAMGKSSFALSLATSAAMKHQLPTLFFSLEMSKIDLTSRVLSADAEIPSGKLRNGNLSSLEWEKLLHAIGRVEQGQLWIDDDPTISVVDIRAKARRIKSEHGHIGLIIIDYLQLMTGRGPAENRQLEVAQISRGLKILARELECPVVALSQLSRTLEQRTNKRPMLSDLRESGAIEQDADMVMFLYRDEVYKPDDINTQGLAEVIIAKHRAGQTATIELTWLPEYTKFANMAPGFS